jgi:nicotinamidase-related amidase
VRRINCSSIKTAVLVIDVQQGPCTGDSKAFDCENVIARINRVARKAREAGAPVILIQHESTAGYLEYGTAAWQLASSLDVASSDIRIRKTTPDSFFRTNVEIVLREHGAERIVCGMHPDFCVDTVAMMRSDHYLPLCWKKLDYQPSHRAKVKLSLAALQREPRCAAHGRQTSQWAKRQRVARK